MNLAFHNSGDPANRYRFVCPTVGREAVLAECARREWGYMRNQALDRADCRCALAGAKCPAARMFRAEDRAEERRYFATTDEVQTLPRAVLDEVARVVLLRSHAAGQALTDAEADRLGVARSPHVKLETSNYSEEAAIKLKLTIARDQRVPSAALAIVTTRGALVLGSKGVELVRPDPSDRDRFQFIEGESVADYVKIYAGHASLGRVTPEAAELLAAVTQELQLPKFKTDPATPPATVPGTPKAAKGAAPKADQSAPAPAASKPATKKAAVPASPPAATPKGKKTAAAPIEKRVTIRGRLEELIVAGKLTDDEIFATIQKELGVGEDKRGYVGINRARLIKLGRLPAGTGPVVKKGK